MDQRFKHKIETIKIRIRAWEFFCLFQSEGVFLKYDPNSEAIKENINTVGFIKMFKNNYAWQKIPQTKNSFNNLKKKICNLYYW